MPSDFNVDAVFAEEFAKAISAEQASSGYAPDTWQSAGRYSDQGADYWAENGPAYARNFIEWFERQENTAVWVTPDGKPAIELDLTADFGGVPVRVVIDVVLAVGAVNPALVVLDIKSGSTTPENARQLAIGAGAIEANYGIRPRYGAFFMARKTKTLLPIELSGPQHSIAYLGEELRMFDQAASTGIFPAHPGESCRRCPVAYACAEQGGPEARKYDRHHPAYRPVQPLGRNR